MLKPKSKYLFLQKYFYSILLGLADVFRTSAIEVYDNERLEELVRSFELRGDLVAA